MKWVHHILNSGHSVHIISFKLVRNVVNSGAIQVHPTRKSLHNLRARVETCRLPFLGRERIILIDSMECGSTITTDLYYETLTKLRRTIQNRRRDKLSSGVRLLHDNACAHTAALTKENIQNSLETFYSPPTYSQFGI